MKPFGGSVAIALIASLGVGCSSAPDDPNRDSTMTILSTEGDRYTIRRGLVTPLLFLPLMLQDGPDEIPRLAESWQHSDDYKNWTYHLRDDVRWHDEVPVTAHDVAFSIELFGHPDVLWATWIWGDIDSVSVPDDHTITLYRNKAALYSPLSDAAHPVPKHLLADLDPTGFYQWDFWIRPVGNGPYRFARHVPRTMFELEANPDFYAGDPSIGRVIVKLANTNPVIELTSGGADVALEVLPTDVLKFEADPEFVVHRAYDWLDMAAIYWNQAHPLFADAAARRALSHAIDRREIARVLHYPEDMPLVGGLSDPQQADEPYRVRGWDQGPVHDPELAARLLETAGWIDRDGVREKDGREARFELTVSTDDWIRGLDQALLIQNQLGSLGVTVEIRTVEYAAWQEASRAGDYEAMISVFENEPPDVLETWFDPSPFGYHDAELVRLLGSLETTLDPEPRDAAYRRINEILRRDMPVTFFFARSGAFVAHRRLRGFRLKNDWNALALAEELWIEEER